MSTLIPYRFRTIFSAIKGPLSAEDSMLVALLSELMTKHNQNLSTSLRAILRTHSSWSNVHRVCITRRLGLSNQIMVISANQDDKTATMMPEGYSCFVTSQGSLLSMPLGSSRCYPAIDQVIDSFTSTGRPPQRSILYIQKMGFQSGVCSPLWLNNEICGFLYLNSRDKESFLDWSPARCLIMAILAANAQWEVFSKYSLPTEYRYLVGLQPKSLEGKALDIQELKAIYQLYASKISHLKSLPSPEIKVIDQQASNALVSHSNIAYSLLRIQQLIAPPVQHIEITLDESTDEFEISLINNNNSARSHLEQTIFLLSKELATLGYKLKIKNESLALTIPFDEAFADRTVLYSVERKNQATKPQSALHIPSKNAAQSPVQPITSKLPNSFKDFSNTRPANELISLVYVSVQSLDFETDKIDLLLKKARDFNSKHDVTGILIWHSGLFLQILEGSVENISKVCQRLEADKRHENIQYLTLTPIKKRIFSEWDMAYADSQSVDLAVINKILRLSKTTEFGTDSKAEETQNIILQLSHSIQEVKKKTS